LQARVLQAMANLFGREGEEVGDVGFRDAVQEVGEDSVVRPVEGLVLPVTGPILEDRSPHLPSGENIYLLRQRQSNYSAGKPALRPDAPASQLETFTVC